MMDFSFNRLKKIYISKKNLFNFGIFRSNPKPLKIKSNFITPVYSTKTKNKPGSYYQAWFFTLQFIYALITLPFFLISMCIAKLKYFQGAKFYKELKQQLNASLEDLKDGYTVFFTAVIISIIWLAYLKDPLLTQYLHNFERRCNLFFTIILNNSFVVASMADSLHVRIYREFFTPKTFSNFKFFDAYSFRLSNWLNDFWSGIIIIYYIIFTPYNNPLWTEFVTYILNIFSGSNFPTHSFCKIQGCSEILYLNDTDIQYTLLKKLVKLRSLDGASTYKIYECAYINTFIYWVYTQLYTPYNVSYTSSFQLVDQQFIDAFIELTSARTWDDFSRAIWLINQAILYNVHFNAIFKFRSYTDIITFTPVVIVNSFIYSFFFILKIFYFSLLIAFFIFGPIINFLVFPINLLLAMVFNMPIANLISQVTTSIVYSIIIPIFLTIQISLTEQYYSKVIVYTIGDLFLSFNCITPFNGLFLYVVLMSILSLSTVFFGVRGVYLMSIIALLFFWLSQFFYIRNFLLNNFSLYFQSLLNIKLFGNVSFNFSLKLDFISASFLFLTTTIGLAAVIYSLAYFKNEPHADRFIILLNWFVISMSLLVIADNAVILFLGWELIGLTSFLLINFWTLRRGTLKSAIKALTFNKISDVFLLLFIIWMSLLTDTADMTVWSETMYFTSLMQHDTHELLCIMLVVAASIKSAQLIAHLWLPDSMEAPIPASALIHSATLVSAGVYLLLRFQFLLINTYSFLFIGILGSFTAVYGSIVSSSQTDAKKLLAYSTISHCGFLFVTIYLLNIQLTLFYLYLHGLFKALTFFCVGNVVKVAKGCQDTRKMGQFMNLLPVESILLVLCCINLGGLPFTVGFYFKHYFQIVFTQSILFSFLAPMLFVAMLLGIVYSYRLITYSLFDVKKANESVYLQASSKLTLCSYYTNSTKLSILAIVLLLIFSLCYFYILFDLKSSLSSTNFFSEQLANNELFFSNLNSNLSLGFVVLFCKFFIVVVFMLLIYTARSDFVNLTKWYSILYSVLFILFFCL